VVVESGGCLTAALDREADFHSVVARLLRNGAVSFSGNSREGIAECELQRQEFWNGVLAGQTVGQAHRRSMNSAQVTILDNKEDAGGGYQYQLRIRTQFGDPALAMHLPGRPRSAPARCVVSGDTLTVHAPAEWWPVKMHVPADWKKWADKDLYVLRGAGTYARRTWCGQEYDREEMYVTAEFTTRRHVAKIEQVQKPPAPLGWNGSYYVDEHADGSHTYRWSVRLADFDQIKGTMVNAVERLEYRITHLKDSKSTITGVYEYEETTHKLGVFRPHSSPAAFTLGGIGRGGGALSKSRAGHCRAWKAGSRDTFSRILASGRCGGGHDEGWPASESDPRQRRSLRDRLGERQRPLHADHEE
jgi:hypothetical protein